MSFSKKSALVSLVVSILSLLAIFIPSLVGMDGMDGGFAISIVSLTVFLIAAICAVVFWRLSVREERIKNGEHLAHWAYTDDEWRKFAALEKIADASNKKMIFYIITGFAVLFGAIFWIADPESGIYVAYVMAVLVAFMGLVAWFSAWATRKRLDSKGEVYISQDGVIVNGQFHNWSILGSSLDDVVYLQQTDPKQIEFSYSYPARYGRQTIQVRVPVPRASETDVAGITSELGK